MVKSEIVEILKKDIKTLFEASLPEGEEEASWQYENIEGVIEIKKAQQLERIADTLQEILSAIKKLNK